MQTDAFTHLQDTLATSIDYRPQSGGLVKQAMTHRSYLADRTIRAESYERLEFLGDRVLGLLIAEMLYEAYPKASEGELSRRLTRLVCGTSCAEVAVQLDLGRLVYLGPTLERKRGHLQASILADLAESLIGALYLEAGLDVTRRFVRHYWSDLVSAWRAATRDDKTALQEWAQGRGFALPLYEVETQSGPDHKPLFVVSAALPEIDRKATGEAGSKKAAEQLAAKALLLALKDNHHG